MRDMRVINRTSGGLAVPEVPRVVTAINTAGLKLIEPLHDLIAMRAISMEKTPEEQMENARIVKQMLESFGFKAQILTSEGAYPAVYGSMKSVRADVPTVLIGGHYDVQPVQEKGWKLSTTPHGLKLMNGPGGDYMFGRGAADDLGQVLTHLQAIKTIGERMKLPLPLNIKILLEGGEESGSPGMAGLLEKYSKLLTCDLVILTDSAPGRDNVPVITTMARGYVGAKVGVKMGSNNPHSGFNLTPNVLMLLGKILYGLQDFKTGRINIPGLYETVREYTAEERRIINEMPFDVKAYIQKNGLEYVVTEEGYTVNETMFIRPGYNVMPPHDSAGEPFSPANALWTEGYYHVGIRIVQNQDPDEVFQLLQEEVYRQVGLQSNLTRSDITIERTVNAHVFVGDTSHEVFRAVEQALLVGFGTFQSSTNAQVDYSACGGTEPIIVLYQQMLRNKKEEHVPVIFTGYPISGYHGHDENMGLDNSYKPGILSNIVSYYLINDALTNGRH